MNARVPETAQAELRAAARPAGAWRATLIALALLLPAIVWLYHDTALAMVTIWSRSDTFAHAYTVPPIVAWLIWRQRQALAAVAPRPSAWGLLPLALAGVLWGLGALSATNAAMQLAFTATLVLSAVALIGPRAARLILFPLAFLFFAVPIGEFVMPRMMEWTADFTVFALRASGIPVFREGLQFVIPSGSWSVVEACSGVRYLIASFMVGVLFAYLNYRSTTRRLVFAAVSLVVPVVANWVRAYLIVMLGHLSGNRIAVGADHLVYGWVFFGIVILLMFMIGARWAEPDAPPPAGVGRAFAVDAAPSRQPRGLWPVVAAALVLAALPPQAMRRLDAADVGATPRLAAPAAFGAGWQRAAQVPADWRPAFQQPAAEFNSAYAAQTAPGSPVGLYLGYYRQQTDASKLVSSNNVLVTSNDARWARLAEDHREVDSVRWRRTVLRPFGEGPRLVAWQLYWVDGRLTASDAMARMDAAAARLRGHGDDSAVIVLYATEARPGDADSLLLRFAHDNLGEIDTLLRRTRDAAQKAAEHRTTEEEKK